MAMAALSPGTLVSISGLQSEAGKALNGGRGIVIGSPAKDSGRFPVLVYSCCVKQTGTSSASSSNTDDATADEQSQGKVLLEIVDDLSGLKRSMKEQNLNPLENQMCEIYHDYASMAWEYAYKTDNIKDALMHLEHYTERWPEDYMCSITYANLIRDGISSSEGSIDCPTDKSKSKQTLAAAVQGGRIKRPAEAWRILKRTEPHVDSTWEQINQFRYAMCVTACDSNQPPQVALDWALQMTTETNADREMKESALRDIIKLCRDNSNNADGEDNNKAKFQINKKVCYALLETSPDSADALTLVAGAECLVGNNQGGAKLYRQAMETGKFHGQDLFNLKENLALAQMQSPGGSLENYDVLNRKDGKFYAIHKKHAGKYAFGRNAMGMFYLQPKEGCGLKVADMLELIDIPDPDDVSVFGGKE